MGIFGATWGSSKGNQRLFCKRFRMIVRSFFDSLLVDPESIRGSSGTMGAHESSRMGCPAPSIAKAHGSWLMWLMSNRGPVRPRGQWGASSPRPCPTPPGPESGPDPFGAEPRAMKHQASITKHQASSIKHQASTNVNAETLSQYHFRLT